MKLSIGRAGIGDGIRAVRPNFIADRLQEQHAIETALPVPPAGDQVVERIPNDALDELPHFVC
jgi:hypothetical protein